MDGMPPLPPPYFNEVVMPSKASVQLNALDPRALASIKSQSNSKDPSKNDQASKSAAKQVESMFIQNMLKQFRQSSKPFESGVLNSNASESYQQMYDQQLSQDLANPGLGMAAYFEQAISTKKAIPTPTSKGPIEGAMEARVSASSSSGKTIPLRQIKNDRSTSTQRKASEVTMVLRALERRSGSGAETIGTAKVKVLPPIPGVTSDPFLPDQTQEADLGFYEPLNEVITSISMENKDREN